MSGRRLVIHLGMPKTGTSVLQNSVMRALTMPGAEHLIYPAFGRGDKVAHHDLARRLAETSRDAAVDLAKELAADIAAEAPPKRVALCSSEAFVHVCGYRRVPHLVAFIGAFPTGMPVLAVLVIREFTDFAESIYLQGARFGGLKISFDDHLAQQPAWFGNLLQGAMALEKFLGSRLCLEYQGGGFDVLDRFEEILDLPSGLLRRASRDVPTTTKMPLKVQIALTHRDWLQAKLGFRIDRKPLVRLLRRGDFFEDDITRYTLYRPAQRRLAYDGFMRLARRKGATGYVEAFAEPHDSDLPHVDLDFRRLDAKDLASLTAHRNVLASRPRELAERP